MENGLKYTSTCFKLSIIVIVKVNKIFLYMHVH
jgi:hypothetical protein